MHPVTNVTETENSSERLDVKRRPDTKLIRKALIDKGWGMARLARAAGLGRAYTSLVVHGHRRNHEVQRRVAKALGVGIEQAFPEKKERGR